MRTIGFDLDGTIADLDVAGKFDLHYWLSRKVNINPKDVTDDNDRIVIISARPKKWLKATESWLRMKNIRYDKLILLDLPIPSHTDLSWFKQHALAKMDVIVKEKVDVYYEDIPQIARIIDAVLPFTKVVRV